MNNLAQKFLMIDENIMLFKKALNSGNAEDKIQINEKFNDYLFKVYFCSYVSKCIRYKSKNIKNKYKAQREQLTLNSKEENCEEECVNNIEDKNINYIEEITAPKPYVDFNSICTDIEILSAINILTDKQKEIIYNCCILQKSEVEVAESLNVSRQAVSKAKNIALKKIRLHLENKHI